VINFSSSLLLLKSSMIRGMPNSISVVASTSMKCLTSKIVSMISYTKKPVDEKRRSQSINLRSVKKQPKAAMVRAVIRSNQSAMIVADRKTTKTQMRPATSM